MSAQIRTVGGVRALSLMLIGAVAMAVIMTTIGMSRAQDGDEGGGSGSFGDETLFGGFDTRGVNDAFWWTIASAGNFDNTSLDNWVTKNGTVIIPNIAGNNVRVMARYNVVGLPNLVGTPNVRWDFAFRYRDNGPDARVLVRLKQYNLFTGEVTNLFVFNSDHHPQLNGWQQRVIAVNRNSFTFDWANNAYFFEAVIQKTGSNGNPGLGIIAIAGVD